MQFQAFDFMPSSRVYDDRGFLRVTGRAARTGVYAYLAKELELTDRDPNSIVYVYRSADEVFKPESLATYVNSDVTNSHPSELVTADTFKETSVGHCLSATQNGDFVEVELLIKDAQAIKDIESGKSQLSPGYTTIYIKDIGICPDTGQRYEFKQTGIDVNHIAIVDRGRGGAQVRIDDNNGVKPMIKVMLDSGQYLEVADEAAAKLVTDTIQALTKRASDAEAKADKAEAKADAMEEELEEEKSKSCDAAIAAKVATLLEVKANAAKVAGDKFTCDSADPLAVMRQAMSARRPAVKWSEKSDAYVQAAFDMATNDSESDATTQTAQLAQLAKDGAQSATVKDAEPSAYHKNKMAVQNAWKGK